MNFSTPFGPSATETSEVEVAGNIRELTRGSAVFRRGEKSDSEMSATGLGGLLGRISGNSRHEIDTLIGELQTLRDKLETDSQRLQNDISEYALLGQHVMQMTKVISESVRKFPDAQEVGK
jgi:hypothetical protein